MFKFISEALIRRKQAKELQDKAELVTAAQQLFDYTYWMESLAVQHLKGLSDREKQLLKDWTSGTSRFVYSADKRFGLVWAHMTGVPEKVLKEFERCHKDAVIILNDVGLHVPNNKLERSKEYPWSNDWRPRTWSETFRIYRRETFTEFLDKYSII